MPLADLRLDATTHDLTVSAGDFVVERDEGEALAQAVRVALRAWQGEWYLDTDFGVDYQGKILVKGAQRAAVVSELRRVVEGVPGVKRIVRLSVEFDRLTRLFTINNGLVESDSGELAAIGA